MTHFTFHAPTAVIFGDGARRALAAELLPGRWGFLSSPSVRAQPATGEMLSACRSAGVEVMDLGNVSPNPRLGEVEHALGIAGSAQVRGILAVGGGSVIDAGKLLRIALQHGGSSHEALYDLDEVLRRPGEPVMLCAVPTTAGTGAEVSRGAIITDERSGAKLAARGAALVPDLAVVDPEFTLSLPPRRTAETGFDVLAHAIETYLSRVATPVTDILALAALNEAPAALLTAWREGSNLAARTTLSLHAWLMGYNLAHASTCLPHRMQYPVGAATDSSHQIGLAALYPAWLRHVEEVAPQRTQRVGAALTAALYQEGHQAMRPHEAMARYLERLDIRVGLTDLGLAGEDVQRLAGAVDGRTDLDPLMPDGDLIAAIYAESLRA
jgi:alcohol dehydrogenase class IV